VKIVMQARHDRATSRMSRLRHLRRRQSGTDRSLPGSGRLREQERSCGRSSCVSAEPTPRPGWELLAGQVNQRRYEALRAYLHEGLPLREAAEATGYTRDALASLVRDLRAAG
jgi:hypothetical protein